MQHWLGVEGMPRRYADYLPADGFTTLNLISTVGAFILGVSTLPSSGTCTRPASTAPLVDTDDPWGWGRSLEWATSCPPPRHNFVSIPRIRSERPAFDLHHPEPAPALLAARRRLGGAGRLRGRLGRGRGMKIEGFLFAFGAVFYAVMATVYWRAVPRARRDHGPGSDRRAGLPHRVLRAVHLPPHRSAPEDNPDAEIYDGAGEYGFFSPHSWWPMPVAWRLR